MEAVFEGYFEALGYGLFVVYWDVSICNLHISTFLINLNLLNPNKSPITFRRSLKQFDTPLDLGSWVFEEGVDWGVSFLFCWGTGEIAYNVLVLNPIELQQTLSLKPNSKNSENMSALFPSHKKGNKKRINFGLLISP